MTRSQEYLGRALGHVQEVSTRRKEVRDIYGGLCHKLPILVRTNGLCQTLAFVQEKATGWDDAGRPETDRDRPIAYHYLRTHVADVLGITDTDDMAAPLQLLPSVRQASLDDYLHHTRTILRAWVYNKRLAASILKVEAADAPTGDR